MGDAFKALDPGDQSPLFEQLADRLRQRMDAGELQPRRAIPSRRQLRERYQVSAGTVNRALDVLRKEGRLVFVRGRGLFVAARDEWRPPPDAGCFEAGPGGPGLARYRDE